MKSKRSPIGRQLHERLVPVKVLVPVDNINPTQGIKRLAWVSAIIDIRL